METSKQYNTIGKASLLRTGRLELASYQPMNRSEQCLLYSKNAWFAASSVNPGRYTGGSR